MGSFSVITALFCIQIVTKVLGTPISGDVSSVDLLTVGGNEATPHEFPWLVSLQWDSGGHFCSGTILSPLFVLTTASCASITVVFGLEIYAGLHLLSSSKNETIGVQKPTPMTIFIHPSYTPAEGGRRNDLALIKVTASSPFVFDEYVSAVRLPVRGAPPPPPLSLGVVMGWGSGAEEDIGLQDALGKTNVSVVGDAECGQIWGEEEEDFEAETMLCSRGGGWTGHGDFCNGDLGAPLVVREEEGGDWRLMGVAAWGQGCGDVNFPSVYMEVEPFLDWIEATMG